jgi:methionine synthase II (cobalamin-independent)
LTAQPLVTGVGSLPHINPDEAASFVLATTTVPYFPQLPNRHPEERMLVQWGDGLCECGAVDTSIGLEFGAPAGPRSEGFGGAQALLGRLGDDVPAVKTQATGPVTLALGLLAAGHPGEGLLDCVTTGLIARVDDHIADVASHLPHTDITLIFDEPGLSGLLVPGFPISATDAKEALRLIIEAAPVRAGIHCCADTDWSVVAGAGPALISWDINALGVAFAHHTEALAAATWAGTGFIWGVVPTQNQPLPSDLEVRLQRIVGRLVMSGAKMAGLLEGAMFSPACGLAGLTDGQAEIVAQAVVEIAGDLAARG